MARAHIPMEASISGRVRRSYGNERQVSQGAVWTVGGLAAHTASAVDDGHGHLLQSGTNARVFTTSFFEGKPNRQDDSGRYHERVALALKLDRARKMLDFDRNILAPLPSPLLQMVSYVDHQKTTWNGHCWARPEAPSRHQNPIQRRVLAAAPFKVLDAPNLRDDFYCSVLAYSITSQTLAVGLGNVLYTWSEGLGVRMLHGLPLEGVWVTSIAFSSAKGGKSVLAIGRSDGTLVLKSVCDGLPRFEVQQPCPVACLSWRPICTPRPSKNVLNPGVLTQTEDLVVGDKIGTIYYYVVEWPLDWEISRDTWPGSMTLVGKLSIHTQQICGLAWSHDGKLLATGGNDNLCCLVEVDDIVGPSRYAFQTPRRADRPQHPNDLGVEASPSNGEAWVESQDGADQSHQDIRNTRPGRSWTDGIRRLGPGCERYRWIHGAAVKAIAFCPWRDGLLATGGGSNDKCIRFFHTSSGSALATIAVSAQVTSLIWSLTRREIVATFGYAQPEHPYRIAVFSWPDCKQVAAIPWEGELRALYAISYPGSSTDKKIQGERRAAQEGCIVVASSDKSVKFHEVWADERKTAVGGAGVLGGSDILEDLEGINKEGDIIR
ncbi:Meiosis-specific APC/C activator protein AMA1 [Paramyrothecium foliicola]|nr:Meiosis-specific APC/C activator protein AMA1 [Paramyrothecium foliicola]